MTRDEVIAKISGIVTKDREDEYGAPEDNFARIATIANVVLASKLAAPLTPLDVSLFLASVKLGRIGHKPSLDSLVDLAGYAVCGASLFQETPAAATRLAYCPPKESAS